MRRIAFILLLVSLGCSNEIRVYSDYDRDFNLRTYKTYRWAEQKDIESRNNPLYYNELTDKRIKKIADDQFRLKGLTLVDSDPDAIVHYHIVIDDKFSVASDPYGFYGPYWTRTGTSMISYKEGTLIIDLMDSKSNNLVWRGYAVSIIEGNNQEIAEETLIKAIVKILEQFKTVE